MNGLPLHTETQRFAYAEAVHEETLLRSIATSKRAKIALERVMIEAAIPQLGALRK